MDRANGVSVLRHRGRLQVRLTTSRVLPYTLRWHQNCATLYFSDSPSLHRVEWFPGEGVTPALRTVVMRLAFAPSSVCPVKGRNLGPNAGPSRRGGGGTSGLRSRTGYAGLSNPTFGKCCRVRRAVLKLIAFSRRVLGRFLRAGLALTASHCRCKCRMV